MDILKASIEWARAEVFSSQFFILFGVFFLIASLGFWQMGKTELARAFVTPTFVAGVLILIVGVGIFFANRSRISSFEKAYHEDATAFVTSELARTEKSMNEYQTIVFKVIPVLIIIACLLIMFSDRPMWRAISTTVIAMLVVILLVDNNANARIEAYHQQLELAKSSF